MCVCAITQPWLTLPLTQLGSERGSLRSKQFQYKLEFFFFSFSLKTRKRKGEKKRGEKMEEIPEEMRVDLQHGNLTLTNGSALLLQDLGQRPQTEGSVSGPWTATTDQKAQYQPHWRSLVIQPCTLLLNPDSPHAITSDRRGEES